MLPHRWHACEGKYFNVLVSRCCAEQHEQRTYVLMGSPWVPMLISIRKHMNHMGREGIGVKCTRVTKGKDSCLYNQLLLSPVDLARERNSHELLLLKSL